MSSPRYALGVDLGTTYTCAAVAGDGAPRVAQLTGTSQTIPSVVSKTDDGMLAGEAAERRLTSHPTATAREFKRRFGDPAPLVLNGQTFGADALTAALLSEVIRRVETVEGTPPSTVALAHPASWGPFRLDLLRSAAAQAGVQDVQLVPEPVAAAVANRDRMPDGSLVAVYDLGGGTFDAAVVRCEGDWSVVGTPEGVERLGGIDFDQAILTHVDAALDGQVFALDSSDPEARSALMQLRAECQAAKEHLSQDTDVEVPVSLPNLRTSVRLTRAEFEAMVRPRLADSLSVLDRVVASADATWDDIAGVLLVGGSANIPAVGQLVGEHTGRPIISATNPHLAIAIGTAAIAQRSIVQPTPAAPPVAAPARSATDATAPKHAAPARSRPTALIVGALVAVAAVVGAVAFFSGGGADNDESAGLTTPATASSDAPPDSAAGQPTPTTVDQPTSTDTAGDDPAATTAATTAAASTIAAATLPITVCASDAGDAVRIGATDLALYIVTPDDVKTVDAASLAACSIDVAGAPSAGLALPAGVTDAVGYVTVLALTSPAGGEIINQTTGVVVTCAGLTGPAAVTDDGVLTVIDGDVVMRYTLDRDDGCTAANSSVFADMAATSIAVGGRNRLAVVGTDRVTGAARLWLVRGADDVIAIDGFSGLDGVVRCGEQWCVPDVAAGVVHLVALDGTILDDAPLSDGLPAPVAEVLDLTSSGTAGAFALVQLSDGSRSIVRLG